MDAPAPTYEALAETGAWQAPRAGRGVVPALGQAPVTVPRGALHTVSWGVRVSVQTEGAGGDAAVDSAQADGEHQARVLRALTQDRDAAAAHPVHGVAACVEDIPLGLRERAPPSATTLRMCSEITAAARAATNATHDAALRVQFDEHPLHLHWRRWLLARLHAEGHVFPGADQPPLAPGGHVDMDAEAQGVGGGGLAETAQELDDCIPAYDAADPGEYVTLVSRLDAERSYVFPWPTRVEQVACWHDHAPFQGPPVSIPISRDHNGVYCMRGIYCSVPCAVSAIHYSAQGEHERATQLANLAAFVADIVEDAADEVLDQLMRPAPPLEDLKRLGGHLTLAEWRQAAHVEGLRISTRAPPYVPDCVLREVQARDTRLLAALYEEGRTIRPTVTHFELPSSKVSQESAFAHMAVAATEQTHTPAMYAEWWRAQKAKGGAPGKPRAKAKPGSKGGGRGAPQKAAAGVPPLPGAPEDTAAQPGDVAGAHDEDDASLRAAAHARSERARETEAARLGFSDAGLAGTAEAALGPGQL